MPDPTNHRVLRFLAATLTMVVLLLMLAVVSLRDFLGVPSLEKESSGPIIARITDVGVRRDSTGKLLITGTVVLRNVSGEPRVLHSATDPLEHVTLYIVDLDGTQTGSVNLAAQLSVRRLDGYTTPIGPGLELDLPFFVFLSVPVEDPVRVMHVHCEFKYNSWVSVSKSVPIVIHP